MRTETKKAGVLDRRHLLKGAGLAIGAAAATTAAAAKDAAAPAAERKPEHGGYRESDEVRTYYKLARY
jgi:ribosomal protein L12E/L44/L45/RPP1/RPP2